MNLRILVVIVAGIAIDFACPNALGQTRRYRPAIDPESQQVLQIPPLASGTAEAGKRVRVTAPEYTGTDVFHTLYLPEAWQEDGAKWPIVFEYTGNYFPTSGSTGRPEDAALGYGLSGGKCIWVSLPYVNELGTGNAIKWWGDEGATVQYAKTNVPRIIAQYNADPDRVVLCGFSRGAIGANYLGLHDDEIARLWSAFVTHDHFDGVRAWRGTDWGSPLESYRQHASERLRRVQGRPYLVMQNGDIGQTKTFVESILDDTSNFTFLEIDTRAALGTFPNDVAIHPHTDRWLLKPSPHRRQVWQWMSMVLHAKYTTIP